MNKIFVANLKANINVSNVGDYLFQLNSNLQRNKNIIVCPTFIHIPFFVSDKFMLGSQDVSVYDSGAYTGEVSAEQLSVSGVKYSIVGHSERRSYLNETDLIINKKIIKLLKNGIIPILCIGETKEEKLMMKTNVILRRKLIAGLANLKKEEIDKIIVAYEPIWAIGTGMTPTKKEVEEISHFIKDVIKTAFKSNVKVLYGGSVNLKNKDHFLNLEETDGFLIGTACINPIEFSKIIEELD